MCELLLWNPNSILTKFILIVSSRLNFLILKLVYIIQVETNKGVLKLTYNIDFLIEGICWTLGLLLYYIHYYYYLNLTWKT